LSISCYQHGIGVKRDLKKTFKLYEKSVKQGDLCNGITQVRLGFCYLKGLGTEKNEKRAFECFNAASANFQKISDKEGGEEGYCSKKDNSSRRCSLAMFSLARCYWRGIGVSNDEKLAAYWYKASSSLGNQHAQTQIGIFYAKGSMLSGFDQNYNEAVELWRKASAQGNPVKR